MANYNTLMVTEKTFQVSDIAAFRKALESLYSDMQIQEAADGTIWIGGYDTSITVRDEEDNEVDVAEIVQKHIKADDYAVIQTVGYEKLRYVTGAVYVIDKEKVRFESLHSVTAKLVDQIGMEDDKE